jgi:SAM-dependent methyltransferase
MDLVEFRKFAGVRHPWEIARLEAVKKVLSPVIFPGMTVLDVGCGDGFVARGLFSGGDVAELTAVDINLSDQRIEELERLSGGVRFLKEPPHGWQFDLLLLMDVIEHVEDDHALLSSHVERQLVPEGKVLITVPSFQLLFGRHDVQLGHYRRYTLKELEALASRSGLAILSSGYLFSSLLLPKLVYNKVCSNCPLGVGNWRLGRGLSSLAAWVLRSENALLLAAARHGLKIPGLSAWALCEKY